MFLTRSASSYLSYPRGSTLLSDDGRFSHLLLVVGFQVFQLWPHYPRPWAKIIFLPLLFIIGFRVSNVKDISLELASDVFSSLVVVVDNVQLIAFLDMTRVARIFLAK